MEERRKPNAAERRVRNREAAEKRQAEQQEQQKKTIEKTKEALKMMSGDDVDTLLSRRFYNNDPNNIDDDDDDEYCDPDEEEDYETEDEGEGEVKERRIRNRTVYKPAPGSTLDNEFKQFQKKNHGESRKAGQMFTLNTIRNDVMRGKRWFGPESDPLSTGKDTDPEAWYTENLWKFVWMPFDQYSKHCNLKDMECFHCGGSVESHRYDWRPMFYHERIVWVYHRRCRCQKCNKTFAEIDPRFLAQLPTRVAERFPFVTTASGPGLHESMVFSFANLFTKRIMFGPYADMTNELHSVGYDKTRCGYYDACYDYQQHGLHVDEDSYIAKPFAEFISPGYYGGIRLTRALLKVVFAGFMKIHEPYMQVSFQMMVDKGMAMDHTHKFSNSIYIEGHPGRVFTASLTGTALGGQ